MYTGISFDIRQYCLSVIRHINFIGKLDILLNKKDIVSLRKLKIYEKAPFFVVGVGIFPAANAAGLLI
jgi:hypothetical protein